MKLIAPKILGRAPALVLVTFLTGSLPMHAAQTLLDILVVDKVTDESVAGLVAGDFEVLQGGLAQELSPCGAERSPLEIVLLVDTGPIGFYSLLANGARQSLAVLRPDDRVAVMTFDRGSKVLLPFTNDWDVVAKELHAISRHRVRHGGGIVGAGASDPKICAALLRAVQLFPKPADCLRRRAIVILTDDRRSPAKIPASDVTETLLAARVTLTGAITPLRPFPPRVPPVAPPRVPRPDRLPEPCCQANPISNATGGDLLRCEAGRNSAPAGDPLLERLLHRIIDRYTFCYTHSQPIAGRSVSEIQVRLTGVAKSSHPDAEIRFLSSNCP
jgi:hypothetical protein